MNVSSWHSLRLRLPLMMSALIAVVLTTFLWVAYRQVERALTRAGGARAEAAADQIAAMLAQLAQQRIVEVQRAAQSAAVVDYLKHPDAVTAAAAHARLLALTAPNQPPIEVWDDMGTRLMVVTGPNTSGRITAQHLPPTNPPSTAGTSAFQVAHDTIFWEGVAAIGEPAGDAPSAPQPKRLGYVLSRRLLGAGATPGAISRLVGTGAVVAMGNKAGNVWTDLSKAIAPPPVDTAHHGMAEYTRPDGDARLGAAAPIAGTPWAVWVELQRRVVVAPARAFLTRMIIVGIAFVIAAAIVAGTISARITTPLGDVTSAAEAIAAGAPGTRVKATRRDEIGRLGVAFNTMAEQVQGVQRDLEQRVQRRVTELRETRQELDGFFAMSLDMLCIVGADGYFKRLNPAWSETLGWSEAELCGRPYLEFVHPDDRESTKAKASEVLSGSHVVEIENRYICRDGSYRWLQWKGASSPGHDCVYAAARDISVQKEADAQIRGLNDELGQRVSDLNALTQELEAFSYSVSHDLRAPLRHITGFATMLDQSAGAALDDQGRRYVRVISEAASRMGRLIDDLLVFSRMGRTEMTLGRVDLATLVEDVRREVSSGLNGRVANWNIHPLPVVRADASTLRQVLTNLLSNALKYTGTRPAADIEIGHDATPTEHVFFVRDNGVGFDMKYAHKLFGVFQRLHSSDDFEGTGIGLANVRRIVHRHGGRVWAESAVGEGATFYFSLPNTGDPTA